MKILYIIRGVSGSGKTMRRGIEAVAVANTFSQAWEAQQYFTAAREYGYSPFVVECQNSFDNVHGVPEQTIQNMLDRWEPLNNGGN